MRTTLSLLALLWACLAPAALVGDVTFEITSPVATNWERVASWTLEENRTNIWRNVATVIPPVMEDNATNVVGFVTLSGVPEGLHTYRAFGRATNGLVGPFSNLVSTNIHGPTNFLTVFVRSSRNGGPMTQRSAINIPPTPASSTSEIFQVVLTNAVIK